MQRSVVGRRGDHLRITVMAVFPQPAKLPLRMKLPGKAQAVYGLSLRNRLYSRVAMGQNAR
jgi:hypothetical protein